MTRSSLSPWTLSYFKPEELRVHVDDCDLTIEQRLEKRSENGFIEKSFDRKWTLPDNFDLNAFSSQFIDVGNQSKMLLMTRQHTLREHDMKTKNSANYACIEKKLFD
ncbi:hypothetical protein NECAME_15030 [Necator americanus]|uniref:SHSP domain-containing protein n=1 Tax=Necator americanus TaxID=51031 RepID=W2SJS9_NECAM|nr:hypothetical protein NECAME_15030 [Necator americanus]ETN69855.1 hypothetical protein NECAME_15030 [Necator americanus]